MNQVENLEFSELMSDNEAVQRLENRLTSIDDKLEKYLINQAEFQTHLANYKEIFSRIAKQHDDHEHRIRTMEQSIWTSAWIPSLITAIITACTVGAIVSAIK